MNDGGRQRLRPWLEAKINSGSIAGLLWWNKEKTMFRIPWKHGGKQDWAPEHSVVFREWAIHTGKFRDGLDSPEYAKWKTRLRCAFNKAPDIKEHRDLSDLDGPTPFKIYEFLPRNNVRRTSTPSRIQQVDPQAPAEPAYGNHAQLVPKMLEQYTASLKSGSLPSDLLGIPSGDLVRGASMGESADTAMLSTSLPSFNEINNLGLAGMPVEVGAAPNGTVTGRASSSPRPGATAPTASPAASPYDYAQTPSPAMSDNVSSPAMSDITFIGSPLTPAMSDVSTSSSGTVHLHASTTEALMRDQTSSPPRTPLSTAGPLPMFPGDLDDWTLPEPAASVWGERSSHSHLVLAPGTLETHLMAPNQAGGHGADHAPLTVVVTEVTDLPRPLQGHEMHVRMQYTTSTVEEMWVTSTEGCRIYYGSDADIRWQACDSVTQQLLGPQNAGQLHFPPCHDLVSGTRHLQLTEVLLNSMQRGVVLEADRGDIYATRFCKCVVNFCNNQHPEGKKLQRNERTKVFDYQNYFLPGLRAHMTSGAPRPNPETLLTFGQQHHYEDPIDNVLISSTILSAIAYQNLNEVNIKTEIVAEEDMEISTSDEFDRQVFGFTGSSMGME